MNLWFNNEKILSSVCDRFLIRGLIYNDRIDALVYGTPNDFIWIKRDDIYKIIDIKKNNNCSAPHFGQLICQPLNRCLNRNPKYEYARDYVQIKWYSLFDDIIEYMNGRAFQTNNVEQKKVTLT